MDRLVPGKEPVLARGDTQPGRRGTHALAVSWPSPRITMESRCISPSCPRGLTDFQMPVALDFRKEDTFKPRLSDAYSDSRYEMGLTLGKILAEANRTHCTNEGPSSPNCKAARAVEGAIRSLKEEKKRISSPETILAELCLADRDLTNGLERLKREKRKGELSGAPNTNEMAHLAGVIVNAEGHVETLSKAYKKAARKKFKSSMCK